MIAAASGSLQVCTSARPASRNACRSRSILYAPQFAGWATVIASGGAPSRSVATATTWASRRAVNASAENGLPATSNGTGSPMRRLNSRTTRPGSTRLRASAASPTRNAPSGPR